jgi:hypothetical protein
MEREAAGRPALLCISPSFAPQTTPTAIRASKLLERLSATWEVTVLTVAEGPPPSERVRVEVVRSRRPSRVLALLARVRLGKLAELFVWPDDSVFWVAPAILAARRIARETRPEAIVVFMMPYSGGLAGAAVSRLTGLPLILNLDDSPTCTDMHPHFPTRLHHRLAGALEDFYVRRADAVVYVSQANLDAVASRQPESARGKLHLVRYGAEPVTAGVRANPEAGADAWVPPADDAQPAPGDRFEIAYVGAMSGWWSLLDERAAAGPLARLYDAWTRLGRHQLVALDQRTSSPAVIGRAILDAIDAHPAWDGRIGLSVYGNPYPASLVERALASAGVERVVSVHGPVPHEQVASIIVGADLLFITLPKRVDGSPGGRISAKTYEYLATDRPILAAVPAGENWDYLADKPGVWLVAPDDREAMREVIVELAAAKLAGRPLAFDRGELRRELSYETKAQEFAAAISAAIARRAR